MKTLAAVIVFALVGCSQRVYSPPTQAFGVGPVTALPAGGKTLDVEVSSHSQIFDPALNAGAGRYSHSIGDRTDVSVEGTVFALDREGTSKADRTIYAGRAGVRTSPVDDISVFAGAGGGYAPAGGGFTSLDAGVSFGIDNCVIVPVATFSGFVSQPIAARPIDVTVDEMTRVYDTPSRTVGGTVRGGLRVSMAPSACRRGETSGWIYGGIDVTTVMDHDSTDSLMGVGLGVTVPL